MTEQLEKLTDQVSQEIDNLLEANESLLKGNNSLVLMIGGFVAGAISASLAIQMHRRKVSAVARQTKQRE